MAWKEAAESGDGQAVRGAEARTTDLTLEDAELLTKGENLDPEGRRPSWRSPLLNRTLWRDVSAAAGEDTRQ